MRLKNYLTAAVALLMLIRCTSHSETVIADFESHPFQEWTTEGEAFGNGPTQGALPGQVPISGFLGNALANSFHGGEDARGSLLSPEFKIEKNYINFLLGGGKSANLYIELLIDGQRMIRTSSAYESGQLYPVSWDVTAYKGKSARIRIVDNQRGPWGFILVDQIVQSKKPTSSMKSNYKVSYAIHQNYLLIPIQEDAPELRITLFANGKAMGAPHDIRLARNRTDYFVPLLVEPYKGLTIDLVYEQVDSDYSGLSLIGQSNSFEFDSHETYRPAYHFSPAYGWTNDPNGMVYQDGKFHLYYQHNPYGSMWGNMTWGHAVTTDFKKWEHLPDAIRPDSLGTIFSGSAVIDTENTAGFGANALVAIYTSAGADQTQSIAYSLDNGRTFTKYAHNPVLRDPAFIDFRDPKVFWYAPEQKWVMSLATTQTITLYSSTDLKSWKKMSEFGQGTGSHDGVWECPDLFPLQTPGKGTKWVLLVSINPGGPNGGSATQYFIGDFNGTTFTADALPYPLWLDYGRDNYAGVTWNHVPASDGRRIFIGWMSNWEYTNQVPTTHFRNAMTLPRELSLVHNGTHLVVANYPVREIFEMRGTPNTVLVEAVTASYAVDKLPAMTEGTYEVELTLKAGKAKQFGFRLFNEQGEEMVYTFDRIAGELIVDRTQSGNTSFSEKFASVDKAPLSSKGTYKINLFIDKASSELFVNEGETVQTQTMFPSEPYNRIEFFTADEPLTVGLIHVYPISTEGIPGGPAEN